MRNLTRIIKLILCLLLLSPKSYAVITNGREYLNRLGVGVSNQLLNDKAALSFKMQKQEQFAIGLLCNLSTSDQKGGYGAGLKLYRLLFLEPNLNFYSSALFAIINKKSKTTSESGFQFDGTFGSEFHFQGLQSLGFSFEMGISIHKIADDFTIETAGYNFIAAGVHFYL